MKNPVKIVIHDKLPEGEKKSNKREVMAGTGYREVMEGTGYLVMVQGDDGLHASLHGQLSITRVLDVLDKAGMLEALEEALKAKKKGEKKHE